MSELHRVRVWPLPAWLDWQRLLGPGPWNSSLLPSGWLALEAELARGAAAELSARLRGVGLAGEKLACEVSPGLARSDVRHARTEEARRYRQGSLGFSRPATRLDEQAKRSLTPEALALQLGQRATGLRVIDACCGAGGNAIGFARAGCDVVAIELDCARLAMAKHNASVYGVGERIEFIAGDACEIVPRLKAELLFVDPPWGDRYDKARVSLAELPPASRLLECSPHVPQLWLKAPPSFAPETLPGSRVEAVFGVAEGDLRRVKFLLLDLQR